MADTRQQGSNTRSRALRMAPRAMGAHPGRGLETDAGWLSHGAANDAAVVEKAAELSVLRPESLTVLIDIVNKCNLRCIMCHFSFDEVFYQRSQLMAPETFAAIAATIRPYTRRLTLSAAYEPTASPHFGEILRLAGAQRFPEISFLTNGNLLGEALIDAVLDSGVTEVCVSVHAARPQTYAHILRGGSLERAVGNVEKLLARRRERGSALPQVQFNVALMRSNAEELVEIVELAARLGVDAVAFRHLIVFEGLDMEAETLSRHDKVQANEYIRRALERAQVLGVRITNAADYFDAEGFDPQQQYTGAPPPLPPPPAEPGLLARLRRRLIRQPVPPPVAPAINGSVDTPAGDVEFYAAEVELRGWALAPQGLAEVSLSRDRLPGDVPENLDGDGRVPLGRARFHNGTRQDVIDAYREQPYAYRAGWSFLLRRRDLPTGADTVTVYAIARNHVGERLLIGQRRVQLGRRDGSGECHVVCRKPFDSLYIDARSNVFPYSDCHTDQPFGRMEAGRSFADVWHDPRLAALRLDMVAGNAPGMCVRCPLFINREVDSDDTFAAHADFSTETMR